MAGIACELRVKQCSVDSCVFIIVLAGNGGRNSFFQGAINNSSVSERCEPGYDLVSPRSALLQFRKAGNHPPLSLGKELGLEALL